MNTRHALVLASLFAVVACNPFHREPASEVRPDANVNSRWRASLVSPAPDRCNQPETAKARYCRSASPTRHRAEFTHGKYAGGSAAAIRGPSAPAPITRPSRLVTMAVAKRALPYPEPHRRSASSS
jgi:hypothetical protein